MEDKKIPVVDTPAQDELKKAEQEIITGYREVTLEKFRGMEKVQVRIYQPDIGVDSVVADTYANAYNRLISDPSYKLTSRDKLAKILEDKNIWGSKDEKLIDDLRERMRSIMIKLSELKAKGKINSATLAKFRIELLDIRGKIGELVAIKQSHFSQTLEGRADEEALKVKLVLCCKFTDGKLLWKNLDELNQEKEGNKSAVMNIIEQAILFWAGINQEVLADLPERIIDFFQGGEENSENLQEIETGSSSIQ